MSTITLGYSKQTRRQRLRKQLAELSRQVELHPTATNAVSIPCGLGTLRISAMQWASVIQAFKEVGSGRNVCHLLAEAVALELKIARDRLSLDELRGITDSIADEDSPLLFDLAIGLSIERDLAEAKKGLAKAGNVDRAELAREAQARIATVTRALEARFSQADVRTAEQISRALPREAGAVSVDLQGAPSSGSHQAGAANSAPFRGWSVRPIWVAVLIVILGLVWLVASLNSGSETLDQRDFVAFPLVTRVVSEPPSLYLTVEQSQWIKIEPPGREQLTLTWGQLADRAHYEEVHVTSTSGRPVARYRNEEATLY